ncbi:putative glutathione transferase [Pyronema domesticum]|nr:putative glutathione transferase [Pyronema domesticum]
MATPTPTHPPVACEDPPDLQLWRERLFHVTEQFVLSEEEWNTYWPHIDNVWSHRSTQVSKNGPIKTHYYDCRLKGRPPGAAPSLSNPNRKKRRRVARERDLCDMKIKVTEAVDGVSGLSMGVSMGSLSTAAGSMAAVSTGVGLSMEAASSMGGSSSMANASSMATAPSTSGSSIGASMATASSLSTALMATAPQMPTPTAQSHLQQPREWGPSCDNGQPQVDDTGSGGMHRHTLAYSDSIKKCSVHRELLKKSKELKSQQQQKTYHKKATGQAAQTVKKHSREHELKLFGSCFCPFVQRVWIALEFKEMDYQYIEIDPYAKPKELTDINPHGLVPALMHGEWGCYESTVLLDYLEDLGEGASLFPQDPRERAHTRLWADHANRNIVPGFYRLLQAQDAAKQAEYAGELTAEIVKLVDASHPQGPFFLGSTMSYVDVSVAPWFLRISRVLHNYRGWPLPDKNSRLGKWIDALETSEAVKNTTSDNVLYIDSYERYAENRPDISQVANAVNAGRGLP